MESLSTLIGYLAKRIDPGFYSSIFKSNFYGFAASQGPWKFLWTYISILLYLLKCPSLPFDANIVGHNLDTYLVWIHGLMDSTMRGQLEYDLEDVFGRLPRPTINIEPIPQRHLFS